MHKCFAAGAVFVVMLFVSPTEQLIAENWNPLKKDEELRKGLRELDQRREVGKGWTKMGRHFSREPKKIDVTNQLRNLGKSSFFGWNLDIDGGNGNVILARDPDNRGSGTFWEIRKDGMHNGFDAFTIRNLANKTKFYRHYLDIDGKTGALMLNPERARGANWYVHSVGDYGGHNAYVIQNSAETPYRGWYLDIDGIKGTLMLNPKPGTGVYWWFQQPPVVYP